LQTEFAAVRCFLPVVPNADARSRIYRLGKRLNAPQFQGALTSRDCLHVTLFFLGEASRLSERSIRMASNLPLK